MSTRRAVPAFLAIVFAIVFFGLGNYLAARQTADSEERLASLRAEVEFLRHRDMQLQAAGTVGRVPEPAVSMMDTESRASIIADVKRELGLHKRLVAVQGTRRLTKKNLILNDATPKIEVDPETYEVRADGELLVCEPAAVLPMAQRYFLF